MNPTIFGNKSDPCVQQLLVAAEYVGCKVDNGAAKEQGIYFASSEGTSFSGIETPLRYFARMRPDVGLYGNTFEDMTTVDSLLEYSKLQLVIPVLSWMAWEKTRESGLAKIQEDIVSGLRSRLEPFLSSTTYLLGTQITIADINIAILLNAVVAKDAEFLKDLPSVNRWLSAVLSQPQVKKHVPTTVQVPKKEVKKSEKKEQPAPPKKEVEKKEVEKKEAQPAAPTAADIEEQIAAEEKAARKKVNPLDLLPPTPLNLDAWKREYSNTKDLKGKAMPWFWDNYDKEGWSLWYMHYDKMEGENQVGFLTANMLGGFLQRLDANFRKYSFGVINVVGKEGDFDINGIWLVRGHEIPAEMKEHPSFEYHTFRKLNEAEERGLIEDYWCNDAEVEGRPIDTCKVWK